MRAIGQKKSPGGMIAGGAGAVSVWREKLFVGVQMDAVDGDMEEEEEWMNAA
jgi:hypothetical protein